ncbi:hypothetical protein GCM10011575_25770 [Microlunatus endophyticus]|uniref:Uncharacterized protein n=1 Tax=Microlunatus endophyticus TaxID=1716077 RepID=A0A917S9S5_9ACTN|nr:hypothetical protein GCM10011575_25770 [Microlunatus endophyticus]
MGLLEHPPLTTVGPAHREVPLATPVAQSQDRTGPQVVPDRAEGPGGSTGTVDSRWHSDEILAPVEQRLAEPLVL